MKNDGAKLFGLIEYAWTILANVSDGDWDKQTDEWQVAVKKWRDQYYAMLAAREGKDG